MVSDEKVFSDEEEGWFAEFRPRVTAYLTEQACPASSFSPSLVAAVCFNPRSIPTSSSELKITDSVCGAFGSGRTSSTSEGHFNVTAYRNRNAEVAM